MVTVGLGETWRVEIGGRVAGSWYSSFFLKDRGIVGIVVIWYMKYLDSFLVQLCCFMW